MDRRPFKPAITKAGQPYMDEAIHVRPKPLAVAVGAIFGGKAPEPVLIGYERTQLRWIKP